MSSSPGAGPRRLAVILNPTKFDDLDTVRDTLTRLCVQEGWAEPLILETTVDDPGVGQAEEAIAAGVHLVCPLGGDGTVRAVATALVGGETVLGLLPGGTGNLLARNLGLPVDSLEEAMRVVLTGGERRIDVGLVRLLPESPSPESLKGEEGDDDPRREDEEVFLVMAGIGLDAEVMAGTSEKIKGIIGWPAYLLAGIGKLFSRGFGVRVASGDEPPREQHARSVIIGNCGTLQGDVELIPDALLDDGVLDAVVLAPHGVGGWLSVVMDLTTRHRRGHRRVIRLTGRRLSVVAATRTEAQIDGDPMGQQWGLTVRVLPAALTVRVAAAGTEGVPNSGGG